MIDELFIYDRDNGLFKKILDKSSVISGRYHLAPNYGQELNTNNLDQYIKDSLSGLEDLKQKYPCVVCFPPKSNLQTINGARWEKFYFQLFFLCTTFYTGTNQIKDVDRDTNTSKHHVWYDWKDMKEVAANFLEVLKATIKNQLIDGVPLKSLANIDFENALITRLSKYNNDKVSGVAISFVLMLSTGACNVNDYTPEDISNIELPSLNLHPIHKH